MTLFLIGCMSGFLFALIDERFTSIKPAYTWEEDEEED
jgi:hypothetical protein